MKKATSNLKLITLLFSGVFLFKSCGVIYKNDTVTVNEALNSKGKIKVITNMNDTYKFESLQKEEEQLYGIAKRNSSTAKKLINQNIEGNPTNKYAKFLLNEDQITKIYQQDKTRTLIQKIEFVVLLPTLALGLLVLWLSAGQ